jgi:hypothetical protein
MQTRNVTLIERFYHELWNRFDKTLIPELLTEDFVFRGSLGQEKRGHAEFAEYVDFIHNAFPDFHNPSKKRSTKETNRLRSNQ